MEDNEYIDAASHWEELRKKIYQASADSLGYAKKKHKDWFDENDVSVNALLDELHSLHIEYANNKDSQARKDRYNHVKQKAHAKLREMKDNWWRDRTEELQGVADTKNIKKFFSELKAVYGPSSRETSPLLNLDGHTVIKEPSLITERWAQHFNQLLNRQSTISEEAIAEIPQCPVIEELDQPPTVEETVKATKREQRDRRICDNHRGISLLSIAGKIFARVIINHLTTHLDSTFPERQCGFRADRGTTDMLFAARQVQEKRREHNLDLYMVFVDLTKAFYSVSRDGLWRLLLKIGCPPRVVKIIRSFHDGMMVRISDLRTTSEAFPVSNGTKQGCVMVLLLFSIIFSAMLQDAFKDCNEGVLIRFRSEGGIFNLQRLKAKTKVSLSLLRELLFADDCALIAYTEEDLQSILNDFARAATRYGLTISIKKTEVMFQPKTGSPPIDPVIKIGDDQLKNACIDNEITSRISKQVPVSDGCSTDSGLIMASDSVLSSVFVEQLCYPPSFMEVSLGPGIAGM
ncbi:uncharacterized protein [Amphiura filiformis]|uniref:uncharacterized protein n=1 Tax=Amphiura filiformis TaxID=82378 RepID=UPI003B2232E2